MHSVAINERPLKSAGSKALVGIEPAVKVAKSRSWSPKYGSNVWPCRWGCGILPLMFRHVAFPLISLFTRLFISVRVEGLENLEALSGPVIFAATHESKIDAVVLLSSLPPRWRYKMAIAMGDWVFWKGWFGGRAVQVLRYWMMVTLGNVFTLPPNPFGLRGTLRHMDFLASKGWSTLIFPEGIHSPWLLPFQAGLGWMACHTGLPVVPIYIDGMGTIRPPTRGARSVVCIHVGKPIMPDSMDFRALTARVEQEIHALRGMSMSRHRGG
jgi:1-acyl-sn-glycerol-3-phosphate acyltransferase